MSPHTHTQDTLVSVTIKGLMTDASAKTPLRMTAQEFVTCIAVMAGAGKVKERKPAR